MLLLCSARGRSVIRVTLALGAVLACFSLPSVRATQHAHLRVRDVQLILPAMHRGCGEPPAHDQCISRIGAVALHLLRGGTPRHEPWSVSTARTARSDPPEPPSKATVALSNGVDMPSVGFGCVKDKATMEAALRTGTLHLDTARVYGGADSASERAIGELIVSELWSDRVFLTTKVHSFGPNDCAMFPPHTHARTSRLPCSPCAIKTFG